MNKIFRKAIVLTLVGSALLYTGCTKDYSGDITTLQKKVAELQQSTSEQFASLRNQIGGLQSAVSALEEAKAKNDKEIESLKSRAAALETFKQEALNKFSSIDNQISGLNNQISGINGQISGINTKLGEVDGAIAGIYTALNDIDFQLAGIYANIEALQQADKDILLAIEAAKARIKALEDNTYTKEEVDGKIVNVQNWATELFATKETVALIDQALATLNGTVEGINNRLGVVEGTLAQLIIDFNALSNVVSQLAEVVTTQGIDIDAIKTAINNILTEIDGIKTDIGTMKTDIADLKTGLASVMTTAETALENANKALGETEEIRNNLKNNYYTSKQVDEFLNTINQAIEAEIAARKAGDAAAQERIDSLAAVTKKIQEDFAAYVEATNTKLGELEGKIDGEIALRVAFQTAQEAKNAALDEKDAALQKAIEDVEEAYKLADKALQDRCAALEGRCSALEGRTSALETTLSDLQTEFNTFKTNTLNELTSIRTELGNLTTALQNETTARENADIAINERITALETSLQEKYDELKNDVMLLAIAIGLVDAKVEYLSAEVDAYAERIQSVVFVPKYTDFAADVYELWLPQGRIQTRVSGTFEVKPASSIDRLEQLVASGEIQVAVRELDSRADYDYLVNDVEVFILDEERGRFEVSAYVGPQVGVLGQDDTPFAISLILGDFTAVTVLPTDEEGTAVDFSAGNSIQSTYVPVAAAKEGARIVPGFVWYDTVKNQPSQLGDSQEPNTELSVALRVPYTKPAEDFSVYTALSEDFDYVSYPEEGKEYPYPAGVELYLDLDGIYMPIATFALAAHVNVADITPTVEAENHTYNPDVDPAEQDELVPFEYAGGIAPATTVTTAAPEGKELKDYVSWYGTHSEEFGFYDKDNNFLPIGVSAFAKTTITKNQVPFFTVDPAYVIPWSYQHPEAVENKVFEITEADGQLYAAVQGVQMNDDENPVNYTKKGSEGYENYPCPNSEDVSFEGNQIFFDKWIFEASDVDYKAGKILFETESDEYDFDVPFVVKKIASDRDVKIDLGEINYTLTNGYSSLIKVIKEGFQAHETEQEDYFIGDAVVAVNEGDDEDQVQLDSLYSNFVKEEPFTIEDITVDGVSINGFGGFHINFAYDVESHEDISTFAIDPIVLGYGKTVVVKGTWTAWGVDFNYEITFKTAEVPFLLVLTPYENYNPEKDKTIYVEGDNTNLDVYTLEQMFYNKYLRVVDKKNYESATGAEKYHGTTNGSDLEVRFIYKYENETSDEGWAKFGLENMTEAEAILERGSLLAFDVVPVKTGYYGDVVAPGEAIPGTVGPNDEILSWGSYNGRQVNVSAALYEAGQKVSEDVIFDFVTYKPIEMKTTGNITTDPEGNPLIRISGHKLEANVAQNLTIGGILSRDADNGYAPYYIADASVFGYMDNNVRQKDVIDPETGDVLFAAGEVCPFYGLLLEPDWTDVTSIVNLKQYKLVENIDFITNGFKFELISDSAKASSEITVPVKLRYMLDYCGKEAEVVNVTIVIQQI